MKTALVWCSLHPGCYAVQYFSGLESHNFCVKWCGRPQFCLAPLVNEDMTLSINDVVEDREFQLYIQLPEEKDNSGVSEHLSQFPGYSSVPARCSFAGRVVPCFDPLAVDACSMDQDAGKKGRRAIVFTHDLQGEPDYFAQPAETYMGHLAAGWAKQNSVDVVLIVPREDLAKFPLGSHTRSRLKAMGVRLVEVDWIRPPLGPGIPKWAQDSWCVNRDFFKLHVLGLDYDAVVFYDNDILVAPMDPDALFALFKCARQGYFLAT
ncbi:unnamed protein product, partial [Polarella glacialis]